MQGKAPDLCLPVFRGENVWQLVFNQRSQQVQWLLENILRLCYNVNHLMLLWFLHIDALLSSGRIKSQTVKQHMQHLLMSLHGPRETHGCFWRNSQRPDFLFASAVSIIWPGVWGPQGGESWSSGVFLGSLLWDSWGAGTAGLQTVQQGSRGGRLRRWTVSVVVCTLSIIPAAEIHLV